MMDILLDALIMVGVIALTVILGGISAILFKLPTKDAEQEYYRKQWRKILRESDAKFHGR